MDKVPAGGLKNLNYAELAAFKSDDRALLPRDATNAMCQAMPPADNCIKR